MAASDLLVSSLDKVLGVYRGDDSVPAISIISRSSAITRIVDFVTQMSLPTRALSVRAGTSKLNSVV